MKNAVIIISSILIMVACKANNEDRYTFYEDKVVDTETGDEYFLHNMDTLTKVNIQGESEEILVTTAPFYGSEELEEMIASHKENLAERKEELLLEYKERIKSERRSRYEAFSDEELMEEFNRLHKDDAEFEHQMDVMAELVERGVVKDNEASDLLEVDPSALDFDIEYHPTETVEE